MIKEAQAIKVSKLMSLISESNTPISAKTVGGGTVKVFMSGEINYYLSDSPKLRELLWEHQIEP